MSKSDFQKQYEQWKGKQKTNPDPVRPPPPKNDFYGYGPVFGCGMFILLILWAATVLGSLLGF